MKPHTSPDERDRRKVQGVSVRANRKPISRGDIAWSYCGVVLSVIWYVFKGSDDVTHLFWALGFFVYATGQKIIREIRLKDAATPNPYRSQA